MSFLSILLFASAFYFTNAQGDWSFPLGFVQTATKASQVPSVPIMNGPTYPEQLDGFMREMSKTLDMTPIMSQLDVTKQDKLKSTGLGGLAGYMNYLLYQIQQQVGNTRADDGDYGGIRLTADSFYDSPFTDEQHAEQAQYGIPNQET